ncbi:DUF5943 domain-containing protein [Paenarthrobacter sp. AB444]|uniref:DUF5943 domain-containing protein n=1 Tax=Paenarthrobacter sp. AB444 TaxID=3025681 RepID=UPI00236665BD|nr:DUF5943 domain-containing protein [Paenarthrobacter sp. AB444]MDD7833835.1 DUF5943 domain-containing protein [Paenarthrobacter sp. AB444]
MAAPRIPIDVDPQTGQWSTDSLPMLYVPVHFFVNNHLAIENELGIERYAKLLYDAGYTSAWTWCEHESKVHHLQGVEVFAHYMNRLSQRGWGTFTIRDLDLPSATAAIEVRHSVFHRPDEAGTRSGDYMFTGWFAGALDFILSEAGDPRRTHAHQVFHEGETDAPYGLFRVGPV